MSIYDDYIYRLSTADPQPIFTIDLPKDLQWNDELTWNKVEQNVEYGLTGSLLIQEGSKKKGRYITLAGVDNMAWITREKGIILYDMASTAGLIMTFQFINPTTSHSLFSYNTQFRHFESPALDIKRILQWDQYDTGAYYIINSIKLMETLGA